MTQSSAMPPAIVFDLDGTLIDSAPDIARAINAALAEFDAAPLSLAETVSFIGNGIPNLCRLAGEARALPPERIAPLTEGMMRHYLAAPAALTRPYAGVVAVLEDLRAKGWRIGLCTNKALAPTQAISRDMDLARHFDAVIGGDSLPSRKPDPRPLMAAFDALGGTPCLYVGDSEVDAQTALNAEIPFALFTEGYRKSPAEALPAALRFASFEDLAAALTQGAFAPRKTGDRP